MLHRKPSSIADMRHPLLQPFLILLACSTTGCAGRSGSETPSYPAAYRAALVETEASAAVRNEDLELFIEFLESIGKPGSAEVASELYSENIHFSDALILTRDKQVIVKHFSDLEEAGNQVRVTMHQKLISGNDVFLVWSMEARFTPIRAERISDSLGVTHLRFDENGRVILHQDFWDSTEGFFRHIPVLGSVVNSVRRRVAN